MAILQQVLENQAANRIADLESRDSGELVKGDFDGGVTGYWVRLDEDGAGVVSYNSKQYITKPLGFTSISSGKPVLLSHANGVYFSSW
jgi:hypothetical protein